MLDYLRPVFASPVPGADGGGARLRPEPSRQQGCHLVQERLIHRDDRVLTFATNEQDLDIGEDLQVMGDRGLGEVEPFADLTARELAGGGDLLHHLEAALVGQSLEHSHEFLVVHVRLP